MLSRVADSLYWMSRYLERAEHTARLLGVNLNLMLEQSPAAAGQRWARLLNSLQTRPPAGDLDAYRVTHHLAFDPANPSSVVASIAGARENARQVRECISSEMWEQLNKLYLEVKRASIDSIWSSQPHEFFAAIKEGAHLFHGITDDTMSRNEGWQFIQVGRYLERAGATAALLDEHFQEYQRTLTIAGAADSLDWVGLLRSCTAFEAYCKVHTADLRPAWVAEFLLLNPELPRSVHFAAARVQQSLEAIAEATQTRRANRAERLAGRLKAFLGFGQIDEIMAGGLHSYLEDVQRHCTLIHTAVHHSYISYPIEAALVN
jgi:uncharacterized alpha-E superfamily protein